MPVFGLRAGKSGGSYCYEIITRYNFPPIVGICDNTPYGRFRPPTGPTQSLWQDVYITKMMKTV